MNRFLFKSSALAGAALLLSNLHADQEDLVYQLEEYVVSVGPIARPLGDYASPVTSLDSDAIRHSSGGTLGQLLDGQPGVTSTSFGAGASRPIIRGFDGPRVRVLESGLGSLDVSETSPDHAVSVEPLLSDRVEVLRGPSTLLYGSSAIGGVVNVVGKEIPRERVDSKGYEGALETRYDSVSEGETHLGYGTVGGENWALHVTGLARKTDDYEIPGDAEAYHEDEDHEEEHEDEDHEDEDHEDEESGDKLESSFVENDYFSVGGTWFFGERNYIGASFSNYDAFYGVPGHAHHEEEDHEEAHDDEEHDDEEHGDESVAIDLERKRFDFEVAIFEPFDWIEAARVRFGYTDYEHTELEGDEIGTVFERDGWELRAELAHYEWAFIDEGVIGMQLSDTDFEATGEEGGAFGVPAQTRNQALFINEHIHDDDLHYEFGGRLEAQQIDAEGATDYSDLALSLAVGFIYDIDDTNSIALSLQHSQRHPTSSELYADGAHLATQQYELGDDELGLETALGVDLSFRHISKDWSSTVSVFYTHFEDYIYAQETGAELDELPVFEYTATGAAFYGVELEVEHLIYDSNDTKIRIGLLGDYVKAENRDAGEDLPRIPPLRIGGKLRVDHGNWGAGMLIRHAFAQNDTAALETDTESYTELKADLSYTFELCDHTALTLFLRANNLLDEEIRHHTSFIKDLAPLPGRNFTIGARLAF